MFLILLSLKLPQKLTLSYKKNATHLHFYIIKTKNNQIKLN